MRQHKKSCYMYLGHVGFSVTKILWIIDESLVKRQMHPMKKLLTLVQSKSVQVLPRSFCFSLMSGNAELEGLRFAVGTAVWCDQERVAFLRWVIYAFLS